MRPAIVLSGYTPGLGVARSLAAMSVPVIMVCYGDHDFGGRSRLIDMCLHAPHPETAENEFIDFLLDLGKRYPGAVLFPTLDDCLVPVSRHKELLESIFVSPVQTGISRKSSSTSKRPMPSPTAAEFLHPVLWSPVLLMRRLRRRTGLVSPAW